MAAPSAEAPVPLVSRALDNPLPIATVDTTRRVPTVTLAPRARTTEPAAEPEPAAEQPPAEEKTRPAPAVTVVIPGAPEVRRKQGPCDHLQGLAKAKCTSCSETTGLRRAFCEGAARSAYCADKLGTDPDCPDEARPDPA